MLMVLYRFVSTENGSRERDCRTCIDGFCSNSSIRPDPEILDWLTEDDDDTLCSAEILRGQNRNVLFLRAGIEREPKRGQTKSLETGKNDAPNASCLTSAFIISTSYQVRSRKLCCQKISV